MLRVTNIRKRYLETLFRDSSFILSIGDKVGLVGLNGCGKSTLLKIIAGEESADEGNVYLDDGRLGYLPQEYSFQRDELVGIFLEDLVSNPYTEMYKVERILAQLDISDIDFYQNIRTLSEGQKMKLKLVELLIENPKILLLDEPTNHLDIKGILWLEEFIQAFEGICILISHDREFLNNICNRILEIDEQEIRLFEGNYDQYLIEKARFVEERQRLYKAQERKRRKLNDLLDRARSIKGGKKRGKAVKAAKSRMDREIGEDEIEKYEYVRLKNFRVNGEVHRRKKILEISNINFSYKSDRKILTSLDLSIWGNQRIWLYGPNGIGKTTLIKLISGELKPNSGNINWGTNINYTYFTQDQCHLDMESSVEEYFMNQTGIPYERSFGVLDRFLFPKGMRKYKLKALSPGQRARLSFACFAQAEYEFLILDEPTNHLDIQTKEVIEDALKKYNGAILLISHDRYFVESIEVDRQITLHKGRLVSNP